MLKDYWAKEYNYGHCTFMWGNTMAHMKDVLDILEDKY